MEYQGATGRFKQFPLRAIHDRSLFPEKQSLVVDRLTGTLTLVDWQGEQFINVCDELEDEQFSLVFTLLERWPSYVPYEQLLEQLGIQLSAQDMEDLEHVRVSGRLSRQRSRAQEQARVRLQPVLRTLRDLLSSSKPCLHDLGIDIVAVMDYGPLLVRHEARQVEQSAG